MSRKPFAESSEQNKAPIAAVLRRWFAEPGRVLEIGAGTGQHAVSFGAMMPHLTWQASDRREYLDGIHMWLEEAALANVPMPALELDVSQGPWPDEPYDYIFSANTVHIMSWDDVVAMFSGLPKVMRRGGVFCLYGPFNYHGAYTSESNARFDQWLQERDPLSGIRDYEQLLELAEQNGMEAVADVAMPANNRILVFRRCESRC